MSRLTELRPQPRHVFAAEEIVPRSGRRLGKVGSLLVDNGYFSEANVNACAAAGIEPVIAMAREAHHPSPKQRFAEPPPPPSAASPLEAMDHRLKAPDGKQRYALRKQTPEPCSASSSRCWDAANSCCVGSTKSAASGAS